MHANMEHKILKYAETMLKYALKYEKCMMVKFTNKK